MKNVEKQNVRNDVKSALSMEATASSQLQGSHLRDADVSTINHLRDADGSISVD
jgi:hypothetical protein